MFVYIGTKAIGNKKNSGAKINISMTAITDPKINPNHRINPPIINPVTKIFHNTLNGSNKILTMISNITLFLNFGIALELRNYFLIRKIISIQDFIK